MVLVFTTLVAGISPTVQPHLLARIAQHPWGYLFAAIAVAGLFGARYFNAATTGAYAFACSCLYMAGIVGSTAFGLNPYVLPSNLDPNMGLTIYNAAAPLNSLKIGLAWFVPGVILATIYSVFAYRSFAGKVQTEEGGY